MKLYYSPTSPFVRIVRLVAAHHGMEEEIELVSAGLFQDETALRAANPLGKIPALVLDDGEVLYDSSVIAGWLDAHGAAQGAEAPLFGTGAEHWQRRRDYALAMGTLDAAVSMVLLARRPEEERSPFWMARWQQGVEAGIAAMADASTSLPPHKTISHIAFPVAADFVRFRLPHIAWADVHPGFSAWVDAALEEEGFRQTDPRLAA